MKNAWIAVAGAVALSGALAACETATPYQPVATGGQQNGGYSDTKIEDNRWRVTFRGNDLTSRNTVENYLLYRAAQLTVDQGYDWFEATHHDTDKQTQVYGDTWGPGWGRGPRWGWGWGTGWGWGPGWGPDFMVDTSNRYVATAEIVLHHGQKPDDNSHAYDARQIMTNLAGKIEKPS